MAVRKNCGRAAKRAAARGWNRLPAKNFIASDVPGRCCRTRVDMVFLKDGELAVVGSE